MDDKEPAGEDELVPMEVGHDSSTVYLQLGFVPVEGIIVTVNVAAISASGSMDAMLDLTYDQGSTWKTVTSNAICRAGKYDFSIENPTQARCRMRLTLANPGAWYSLGKTRRRPRCRPSQEGPQG